MFGRVLKASLLPLVLLYWALPPDGRALLDVPCLFTLVFGIHCPGCGMKSAILHLLELDWRGAIAINPLAPLAFAALAWVSLQEMIKTVSNGGFLYVRVHDHRAADDDERALA